MKFPYGVSDFYQMITEDYYYVDRTHCIPLLEDAGKALLFLRPRRFGKIDGVVRAPSLFSMTLVVLPSMMATHELVVPRSMPMILPMLLAPER